MVRVVQEATIIDGRVSTIDYRQEVQPWVAGITNIERRGRCAEYRCTRGVFRDDVRRANGSRARRDDFSMIMLRTGSRALRDEFNMIMRAA